MTNREIWEYQQKHKRLRERAGSIVADLRTAGAGIELCRDAADVIEWLQQQLQQARKEFAEEQSYAQRVAREAHREGIEEGRAMGRERW